jgi:hypothetical protein
MKDQKLTIHDSPAQNGVAKRRNRTILERVRALLHASGLLKNLWGEAARHVVWLMNRTSTKAIEGKTPFKATFGKKPSLTDVREWGECYRIRCTCDRVVTNFLTRLYSIVYLWPLLTAFGYFL